MRSSILCPLPVPGENKRPGESGTDEPQRKIKRTKRAARKLKSQIVLSSEEEDDKEDDDEEQPELVRHRSIRPDPEPVVDPAEAPPEDVRVEDASEPSAPARASPGTDHPVTSPPSSSTWGQLPDDIPMMGGSFETFFDGVPSANTFGLETPRKDPQAESSGTSAVDKLVDRFPAPSLDPNCNRIVTFAIPKDVRALGPPVGVASYLHHLMTEEDRAATEAVGIFPEFEYTHSGTTLKDLRVESYPSSNALTRDCLKP
ncbi:PREDICTED: uncharacterized protein LOC109221895 [Nicotiana attenuata]|uniref:uncharacterized protein LOC109221895 n=1 Tax=Nicotiana attenuata TaxID=49451 RepID=UPI0009049BEB|nr:PREDICTED: uncharacterized protein LOC109221895 [Nicotiana attenuata]